MYVKYTMLGKSGHAPLENDRVQGAIWLPKQGYTYNT